MLVALFIWYIGVMLTEYTIVLAVIPTGQMLELDVDVLVVLKDRPDFLRGLYNLPGGKLEPNETPIQCAERELAEETGIKHIYYSEQMGKIVCSYGVIHCVKCEVGWEDIIAREGETEIASWIGWEKLANNSLLIPNLRVIVPMMLLGVKDFVVSDEGSFRGTDHTFAVTMKR